MTTAGARITKRRRMLSVTAFIDGAAVPPPPNKRGRVTGWNDGMANRLSNYISNFREDFRVMVTLTYPESFPSDGGTVKRHLRAFFERLRRTGWLEKHSAVWFLEFQKRGAPHFHLLCTDFLSKQFISLAWSEITGGDPSACSRVESLRRPESAGAYARKYAVKSEQKDLPCGFERVGRMWGCVGPRWKKIGDTHTLRQPFVAAAIEKVDFYGIITPISRILTSFKGRIVRTMSGWVFYGDEKEVERLWHWLRDADEFAGRTASLFGNSQQRPWGAQHATAERPESVAGKFLMQSRPVSTSRNATANAYAS